MRVVRFVLVLAAVVALAVALRLLFPPECDCFELGSTGVSTGPHLHFELWEGGVPVDPTGRLGL